MKTDFQDKTILMSSSFVMTRAPGATTAEVVREQLLDMRQLTGDPPQRETERTIATFVK